MNTSSGSTVRTGLFPFVLASLALAIGAGRLVVIETTQGAELRARADSQQSATMPIPAQRGDILDARGRVLAGSIRRPSIFADPFLIPDIRFAAYSIAPVLKLNAAEVEQSLREALAADRHFVWIKRQISDEELAGFSEVREAKELGGLVVRYEAQRKYLNGRLASHVLGFLSADNRALAGVELTYDSFLRGVDGSRTLVVNTRRQRVSARPEDFIDPRDGASVVLTIDAYIQECTEKHLTAAAQTYAAEWATAVVLDPQSGEVLAMATYPDFDPADPIPAGLRPAEHKAAEERLFNRAISGAYEPGSLFKPFVVSCALEDGLARYGERFVINGPTRNWGRRTIHDTHTYSTLLLEEVVSKSSNIGMGMIGERVGNERLNRYVRRFGFGDLTGIDLPGEHEGLVQDFSRWTGYSTQSIPIGQEIAITPLQALAAFSVFCNGGILYRPRIVRGIVGADGTLLRDDSRPVAIRRVLDTRTADSIRLGPLVDVVLTGTGTKAAIPDYQLFGKTGTAQIARPGGHGYLPGKYMGSFLAGAPSDEPRVAAIVSIFKPGQRAYYGGTVAAPAAAAIVADALNYMRVPPQKSMPDRRSRGAGVADAD
ncbi:MAG: Stage V sporulation protein D [Phycisphaerae bacterium]|nr:Stage V sporulation protein D [Phycisphaerae bacterium]